MLGDGRLIKRRIRDGKGVFQYFIYCQASAQNYIFLLSVSWSIFNVSRLWCTVGRQ